MTDSGWQYPGGEPPSGSGPYGAPPPQPPQPPPSAPPGASWGQPGYGAPEPPPPSPRKTWPIVALVGAVALLVAAIVGVLVTSDSGDDTATDDTPGTTEPSDPSDPEDPDDPDGPSDPNAFVDEEGGYALTMPDSWAFSSLHGDLSEVGSEMFPDDPAKADLAQQSASALPRAIIFYGVVADEVGDPFVTNVNVNVTSTPGAGDLSYDEFSSQVKQGIGTIGATVTADEPFTLAGAEGVRIEFDYDESLGASGVQYSAVIDDELWVVNFASTDVAAHLEDFQRIAQSFEVTG